MTDYISALASEICAAVPAEARPAVEDDSPLYRIYAVLALAKGVETTSEDVHNAWVAWMGERDPEHEALRRFDELDASDKAQDEPFVRAIHAVARRSAT